MALRKLVNAEMVTIFAAADNFGSAKAEGLYGFEDGGGYNDFERLANDLKARRKERRKAQAHEAAKKGRGEVRAAKAVISRGVPPFALEEEEDCDEPLLLPHPGIARRAGVNHVTVNCADMHSLSSEIYDNEMEKDAGFHTRCVMAIPVMHAGETLGVVQLTNKRLTGSFKKKSNKGGQPPSLKTEDTGALAACHVRQLPALSPLPAPRSPPPTTHRPPCGAWHPRPPTAHRPPPFTHRPPVTVRGMASAAPSALCLP